jgi:hypothetical protein
VNCKNALCAGRKHRVGADVPAACLLISMATPWISETVRERWFVLPSR